MATCTTYVELYLPRVSYVKKGEIVQTDQFSILSIKESSKTPFSKTKTFSYVLVVIAWWSVLEYSDECNDVER